MSIKRLTSDERATYLIGLAARRSLEDNFSLGPESAFLCSVIEEHLTEDEVSEIALATSFPLGDKMRAAPCEDLANNDDVPF